MAFEMKTIKEILNKSFPYLDSFNNKFLLIGFLALLVFVFLAVYAPFNMNQWGDNLYVGYVSIGIGVLLLTQFILRPALGFRELKVSSFMLWFVAEVLLITFGIYVVYSPELTSLNEKIYEYYRTLRYVVLIMVAPYFFILWYLSVRFKFASLEKIEHNNLTSVHEKGNELLTITGENNKVILAINYDQLLYVKSSGNYLNIYHLKGEKASKELVRLSLKELETKIIDSSIVRIHRSYMVNKHKISSFKKTRKGYKLIVQHASGEMLPVSIGYRDKFEEALEL
ncbi:LytR/AlgR family response regulator transcription factor [Pareuzebyella sediminis]|uniref:LytR/AlgR family response regulator transcription factor n=1 Tax=Pareuzebyella sediminis TaxID=2607998 RepID=UPI0011EBC964|nr:LytTR family DNA-binding domain-containing protein [Pareuzebyella sediminis]